jgi:hypothetical protein
MRAVRVAPAGTGKTSGGAPELVSMSQRKGPAAVVPLMLRRAAMEASSA